MNYKVAAMALAATFLSSELSAQPFAYISNQLGDSVSIIDTATAKVVDTVKVAGKPAGVAISPDGKKVYISTPEAHGFSVIDADKRAVIKTVKLGEGALGIAASPDGQLSLIHI